MRACGQKLVKFCTHTLTHRASINHGRNMDDPWINVSITGCAYRAELILGR